MGDGLFDVGRLAWFFGLGVDPKVRLNTPIHIAAKIGDIYEGKLPSLFISFHLTCTLQLLLLFLSLFVPVRRILTSSEPSVTFPSFLSLFRREIVDLDAHDTQGYAPIHIAAKEGHLEVVRALLNYEANINLPDGNGYTPLFLAIHHGHIEVAKYLLEMVGVELLSFPLFGQSEGFSFSFFFHEGRS